MQKLKFFTLIFFTIPLFCLSQDTNTIKREIANLFAKADKKKLQNVLPFEINDKTGLIDAATKKTILDPTKKLFISTIFNPNMKGSYKGYDFEINQKFQIKVIKPDEPNQELAPQITEYVGPSSYSRPAVIYKNNYKGFEVNNNGDLESYSNIYVPGNGIPAIRPFKYKGKYYGIAGKKTENNIIKYGIIDTEGNIMPHFDFIYDQIYRNSMANTDDDSWFAVNADQNNSCDKLLEKSFYINMNGEEKIKGELADYPGIGDYFGLDANASGCITFSGVFDVKNIKWIIKPQSKIKIRWLDYTSKEVLDAYNSEDRNKAKIYIKAFDKNSTFYMDLDLKNKYLPTKGK